MYEETGESPISRASGMVQRRWEVLLGDETQVKFKLQTLLSREISHGAATVSSLINRKAQSLGCNHPFLQPRFPQRIAMIQKIYLRLIVRSLSGWRLQS